ncbi:MAG: hypothetical protein HY678_06040, partial [Chloroflexi bacterium]|nr:hypothetical protein [Chloroflexota bacterium]
MIYIEYFSRRAGVPLMKFHEAVIAGQQGWANAHSEDRLVWSAGRTWRMGPEPEYMGVWWTPGSGFDRIDEWDRIFRSGEAAGFEDPFGEVARIDAAGCYEPLLEPVSANGGTYYAEFFRLTATRAREATTSRTHSRTRRSPPTLASSPLLGEAHTTASSPLLGEAHTTASSASMGEAHTTASSASMGEAHT